MKDFTLYPEAFELKQLGFNEPCFGYFTKYEEFFYFDVDDLSTAYTKNMDNLVVSSVDELKCSAPTYSQAFRFFREKHNIHAWIINAEDNHNVFKPFFRGANIHDQHLVDFYKTYEEAELACLKKLIELVKSPQG